MFKTELAPMKVGLVKKNREVTCMACENSHVNAPRHSVWQVISDITKQKTTQVSPLNLLICTEATTQAIRALVRDVTIEDPVPNREALREFTRSRARQRLSDNQANQDEITDRQRHPPRQFHINDLVLLIKFSQVAGKLDPGICGSYKVVKVLPSGLLINKLLSLLGRLVVMSNSNPQAYVDFTFPDIVFL
ncbi:unnamed protein product [Euphydryas editha]|uniref:Uncharacterized protein n=1 Tax=Euphydryas editha TaxID=104508 RepID=A0AAU9U7Q4_EUPED|nr:unnamed protein product [Euphydryas editha]